MHKSANNSSDIILKKKAFTLIELSIALIIISMLVTAVVGGNGIIQTSRLMNAIAEFNNYRSSYLLFNAKFHKPPGDYDKAFSSFSPHGNDDGLVQFFNDNPSGNINESGVAWQQLNQAHFLDITLSYNQADYALATNASMTRKMPKTKIKNGYWIFDYNYFGAFDGVNNPKLANILLLTALPSNYGISSAAWGGYYFSPQTSTILKGEDAIFIDNKIDDKIATKGRVRGQGSSCIIGDLYYNTGSSSTACNLQFYNELND